MNQVKDQYEAYPYPERDPRDETKRLISGSPSHPLEIDHFLFAGQRDWSKPLRVLVAGGGTGDGLIQLAQMLTQAGKKYDITYVDLSQAYNLMVRKPYPHSHETLRRADPLYDLILVTNWNWPKPEKGRGSCIFLHQWRRPGYPTEGCIAFRREHLRSIAKQLTPGSRLVVNAWPQAGR